MCIILQCYLSRKRSGTLHGTSESTPSVAFPIRYAVDSAAPVLALLLVWGCCCCVLTVPGEGISLALRHAASSPCPCSVTGRANNWYTIVVFCRLV